MGVEILAFFGKIATDSRNRETKKGPSHSLQNLFIVLVFEIFVGK